MDSTALTLALLYAIGLNLAGGLLTDISDWYVNLKKPWFQPPGWAFAPAWLVILGLAGWALYIGWAEATGTALATVATAFGINALLHFGWSLLFFKMRRPDWSYIENYALIASCAVLIAVLWPVSRFAAALIVPYFVWTCFAQAINYRIITLNGSFGPSR